MAYTITANARAKIDLAPETLVEEVLQNTAMILSTIKTTAPLHRDFGLSARFLDRPTPAAEALLIAEVFDAIEEYEPRAEILNVSFERDGKSGKVIPRLEVEIHGG
jgi:phage baseplate assembly protein W